jgi:hypothetical protein
LISWLLRAVVEGRQIEALVVVARVDIEHQQGLAVEVRLPNPH